MVTFLFRPVLSNLMASNKFVPIIGAVLAVLLFAFIAFKDINLGFLKGDALPTQPDMEIFMYGIVAIGTWLVYFSIKKVVSPYGGKIGEGFTLMTAGIILFMGVTVLDITIHKFGVAFNHLTHFLWHFTEFAAIIFFALGMKKLSELASK